MRSTVNLDQSALTVNLGRRVFAALGAELGGGEFLTRLTVFLLYFQLDRQTVAVPARHILGLHLIIEKMAWLHTLIMVGGGLYLCWMGYQMLRGALKKEAVSAPAPQVELAKSGRSFLKGLLTNLANPKAIIYFGSVFSLFVGDNVGTTARWGIFALIIVETLAWFTVVASLFALPQMRRGYQRLAKWIDGFAGALFAGFGIHLIISR